MSNAPTIALHPRQTEAFQTTATELLYGGAAGGGKSHLMRSAMIAWCGMIPGLQAYLFRRVSDDLVKNHMEGPTGFPALLGEWIESKWCAVNYSKGTISFWNGSKIFLCHCQHEKDMHKYQGAEIHLLCIDELTHFTSGIYRYLVAPEKLHLSHCERPCPAPNKFCPKESKGKIDYEGQGPHPFAAVEGGSGQEYIDGIADDTLQVVSSQSKI